MKKTRKHSIRRDPGRVLAPADLGQVVGGHEVGVIERVAGDDLAGGSSGPDRRGATGNPRGR
jgi:hypothetical protein